MPEWSLLQDAYGPADRVPELLARASAETDLAADVWVELWGHRRLRTLGLRRRPSLHRPISDGPQTGLRLARFEKVSNQPE
jgi:hypothetical protein